MKEIRHLKTMKNKRNLNTKWLLLQNNQNADTTLLHSHDDMSPLWGVINFCNSPFNVLTIHTIIITHAVQS